MGPGRPLNASNLTTLGAERLAELLIETARGRTVAQRLLRLELSGLEGTAELAREVRQRLATIERSQGALDSRGREDLVDELELHRKAIVDRIAPEDAGEALDLMWRFMGLANPILDRCREGDETFARVFDVSPLGDLASAACPDPGKLADGVFERLTRNTHGQYDDLVRVLAPALGEEGLERMKRLAVEYSRTPVARLPEARRPRIDRRYLGTAGEDDAAENMRLRTARSVLQDIADAQGDVDAFIG